MTAVVDEREHDGTADTKRFRDDSRTLYDFADEVLVVCPACESCAMVRPEPGSLDGLARPRRWSAPRRLTCISCGLHRHQTERGTLFGAPLDPYFRLPLWLRVPAVGHVVWAFNADHLDHLRRFVAAELRERPYDPTAVSASLVERLPSWFGHASHRAELSRAFAALAERLPS